MYICGCLCAREEVSIHDRCGKCACADVGVRVCIWPSAGGQAWDQVQKETSLEASACPGPTQPPTPTMQTDFLEAAIMQGCSQQPGCLPRPSAQSQLGQGSLPSTTIINSGLSWAISEARGSHEGERRPGVGGAGCRFRKPCLPLHSESCSAAAVVPGVWSRASAVARGPPPPLD